MVPRYDHIHVMVDLKIVATRGITIGDMAGPCLPASPAAATLWLYAEWSDLGEAPDMELEGAYMKYLNRLFERRVAPSDRAKQRRLGLDPITE